MDWVTRKPVFWVSNQVIPKPASLLQRLARIVKFHWYSLQKGINTINTMPMRRVVCTYVVCKPLKTCFLALRPIWSSAWKLGTYCICTNVSNKYPYWHTQRSLRSIFCFKLSSDFPTLCMWTAKAQASLCLNVNLPELSLLSCAISTESSYTYPYIIRYLN